MTRLAPMSLQVIAVSPANLKACRPTKPAAGGFPGCGKNPANPKDLLRAGP
jgi:hypothetical protein